MTSTLPPQDSSGDARNLREHLPDCATNWQDGDCDCARERLDMALAALSRQVRSEGVRVCSVCKATVAVSPETMCCHCVEVAWKLAALGSQDRPAPALKPNEGGAVWAALKAKLSMLAEDERGLSQRALATARAALNDFRVISTGRSASDGWASGALIREASKTLRAIVAHYDEDDDGSGYSKTCGQLADRLDAALEAGNRAADEATFLLARIDELDWTGSFDDFMRDWNGHVDPPLSRLRSALTASPSALDGEGDR